MFKSLAFLPKQRIRCAETFDAILRQGNRLVNIGFVFCSSATTLDYPRLGMIVSKKHCQLSVHRNRIKRKIREHFRFNQHALSGVDLVVLIRSSTQHITDREQDQCLEKLFSQLVAHRSGHFSH